MKSYSDREIKEGEHATNGESMQENTQTKRLYARNCPKASVHWAQQLASLLELVMVDAGIVSIHRIIFGLKTKRRRRRRRPRRRRRRRRRKRRRRRGRRRRRRRRRWGGRGGECGDGEGEKEKK